MKPTNKSQAINKAFECVKGIILTKYDVLIEDVKPGSNIKYDFGLDSLDFIELVIEIEKELNISLPDEELIDIKTVKNLTDVIEVILLEQ
jgi:acyl carrier protein